MPDIDHVKAMFSGNADWHCDIAAISDALRQHRDSLFIVDGHCGSGKSYLAGRMAHCLRMAHVDIDPFCAEGKETYLAHVDYTRLNNCIGNGRNVILSGVMALAVVDQINRLRTQALKADVCVYVVRIAQTGSWPDDSYHDENASSTWRPLEREIWQYNLRFKPSAVSGKVFYRFCT